VCERPLTRQLLPRTNRCAQRGVKRPLFAPVRKTRIFLYPYANAAARPSLSVLHALLHPVGMGPHDPLSRLLFRLGAACHKTRKLLRQQEFVAGEPPLVPTARRRHGRRTKRRPRRGCLYATRRRIFLGATSAVMQGVAVRPHHRSPTLACDRRSTESHQGSRHPLAEYQASAFAERRPVR
jgi:hypothetical protein